MRACPSLPGPAQYLCFVPPPGRRVICRPAPMRDAWRSSLAALKCRLFSRLLGRGPQTNVSRQRRQICCVKQEAGASGASGAPHHPSSLSLLSSNILIPPSSGWPASPGKPGGIRTGLPLASQEGHHGWGGAASRTTAQSPSPIYYQGRAIVRQAAGLLLQISQHPCGTERSLKLISECRRESWPLPRQPGAHGGCFCRGMFPVTLARPPHAPQC